MLTVPAPIVAASTASTTARARFTTTTMRRRSKRSAIAPAGTPKRRFGRYWLSSAIETSSGSRVSEATSSGPAARAMPSPTLVTSEDARSQRKLRPSRAGAMVSAIAVGQGAHRPAGYQPLGD